MTKQIIFGNGQPVFNGPALEPDPIAARFEAEKHAEHTKDSDCTVDPATNLCTGCGVEHGEPCFQCGGRGFHTNDCCESPANAEERCEDCHKPLSMCHCDAPAFHEDTDSLEDRGISLGSYES